MSRGTPDRSVRGLLLVLAVAAIVRLAFATDRSLWIDEIYRLSRARGYEVENAHEQRPRDLSVRLPPRPLADVLALARQESPPLHPLFLNVWLRSVDVPGDFPLRLPFIVFGCLTVLGAWRLGREVGDDRVAAWLALIVALSACQVQYAHEVNFYALAGCFVVFSHVYYLRWLRDGTTGDGVTYAACAALGLYTHYYVGLVILAQAIGVVCWHGWRIRLLARAALPFVLVTLLFAPWMVGLLAQLGTLVAGTVPAYGGWPYLANRLLANPLFVWLGELANTLAPTSAALLCAALAMLVWRGLVLLPDVRLRRVVLVNVVVPPLLLVVAYLVRRADLLLWPRYQLMFAFMVYLPVAVALARLRPRPLRLVTAAAVLILLAAGLDHYWRRLEREDWRAAAAIIAGTGAADDAVILYQPNLGVPLAHYLDGEHRLTGVAGAPDRLRIQLDEVTAGRRALWAVLAWDFDGATSAAVRSLLACRFPPPVEHRVTGITLLRYEGAPPAVPSCGVPGALVAPPTGCAAVEGRLRVPVTGWIDVPDPAARILLQADDGPLAVTQPRDPPDDAAGLPPVAEGAVRRWFATDLDLGTIRPGTLATVHLRAALSDGTVVTSGATLPCVRRPRVAERGTGSRVAQGTLSGPHADVTLAPGEPLPVSGWAFAGGGIREIAFTVDGEPAGTTHQHGFARWEVAAAFPQRRLDLVRASGFVADVDTRTLAAGPHVLRAAIVRADGSVVPIEPPLRFRIAAGGTTQRP